MIRARDSGSRVGREGWERGEFEGGGGGGIWSSRSGMVVAVWRLVLPTGLGIGRYDPVRFVGWFRISCGVRRVCPRCGAVKYTL